MCVCVCVCVCVCLFVTECASVYQLVKHIIEHELPLPKDSYRVITTIDEDHPYSSDEDEAAVQPGTPRSTRPGSATKHPTPPQSGARRGAHGSRRHADPAIGRRRNTPRDGRHGGVPRAGNGGAPAPRRGRGKPKRKAAEPTAGGLFSNPFSHLEPVPGHATPGLARVASPIETDRAHLRGGGEHKAAPQGRNQRQSGAKVRVTSPLDTASPSSGQHTSVAGSAATVTAAAGGAAPQADAVRRAQRHDSDRDHVSPARGGGIGAVRAARAARGSGSGSEGGEAGQGEGRLPLSARRATAGVEESKGAPPARPASASGGNTSAARAELSASVTAGLGKAGGAAMMAALAPESTTQAQAAVRRQLDECRALREGMADAIAALLKDA